MADRLRTMLAEIIDLIEQMIGFARAVVKVLRTLEDCLSYST